MAQKVLLGKTKGYKNHPQLVRFKETENSAEAIANYLRYVADEADKRNYKFNREKIFKNSPCKSIAITEGQLEYEFRHLLSKLKTRDPFLHKKLKSNTKINPHPLFTKVEGGIEKWEVIYQATI